ncbi:nucleoside triphosphate pyrophosphohydrolase [Neobacillus notoginsengisoli]|uniref:Nucleoside triphosphate pyrophosphohydrolase n=1 Tax=Neobacillus notoginsengisoli TaxID=1578198 RepID=A0A417YG65_9BACI|nr:nucleoside triphosphate pyrophosphohydrolase [Neobacillus notoginsengisoli]RHW31811.1 nucleoside triphosphate pyrophosphohydrolase [Neobacillus notoginsengisoli]
MTKEIEVVGLGAGGLDQLPLGVYRKLMGDRRVFLRTKEHPVVRELEEEHFSYTSFDSIYEKFDSFEAVYEEICRLLVAEAAAGPIIYAVPGHPLVAERTIQLLLDTETRLGKVKIRFGGGQSFLDALFQTLKIDPVEGFQLLDGTALRSEQLQLGQHMFISQVYDRMIASDVKLTLMERLPDEYEVYIVTAAGSSEEKIVKVPLYELDHKTEIHNLVTLYVPPVKKEELLLGEFSKLRDIIAVLRGPEGCPWDQEQTHESLKKYLIEETYEVIEAIDSGDIDHLIEELGDVLLQIMLHAQIGEEEGYFTINDVVESIASKMIRRHPHVFGNKKAETPDEVVANWQEIKAREKGAEKRDSRLDGIPKSLPALLKAFELQKKAAKVGFDWEEIGPAFEKVKEELREFEAELSEEHLSQAKKEFGDLLFAFVNVARFLDIHPEEALIETNEKFIRRFKYIEEKVKASGRPFEDYSLEQLDDYWNEAKEEGL